MFDPDYDQNRDKQDIKLLNSNLGQETSPVAQREV
jgi:hypothetical protein